jgi:tetratricopeptide (TPR) repeat protein
MPLAILLAAAWMGVLAPDEILAEIAGETAGETAGVGSLDFLAADWRDAPRRQRSMRAVLDSSWRLLSEHEREVLQGLSVFRGGFTRQAARQVAGASLRDLKALLDRSLLHRDAGGRYEMHELLRQYAVERLERLGKVARARDAHCAYYVSLLEQFAAEVKGPRQDVALAEMDREIGNALVAWETAVACGPEHALDYKQIEWLDRAMDGLGYFCHRSYRYVQGEAACRAAAQSLERGEEPPPGTRLRVLAKALSGQGQFVRQLGQRAASLHLLRQARSVLDAPALAGHDTRAERAFVLLGIGWSLFLEDRAEASRCFSESVALYRALGDPWHTAQALRGLREAKSAGGDFEAGSRHARESIALSRALGDWWGTMRSGWMLAVDCAHQGRAEEAERVARESFALEGTLGKGGWAGHLLRNLGMVLSWAGNYAKGQAALKQSVTLLAGPVSARRTLAKAGAHLAQSQMHLGRYGEARAQAQRVLALAERLDSRDFAGWARLTLGDLALVDAAYETAWEWLADGAALLREAGRRYALRLTLASLVYAARGLGDGDRARRSLCECLEPGEGKGSVLPVLCALPAAALLLLDQGEAERAVELYALAERHSVVANSRWFEDVAGREIATVAEVLSPEVVTAARERGWKRDQEATVVELLAELSE